MNNITEYNIKSWVDEAPDDIDREFREAVHTILTAIALDSNLKANMILKGGMLLAIKYRSTRFTKDIDFSTEKEIGEEISIEKIKESLDKSLTQRIEELDYDLDCRVQSSKLQPNNKNATYPSMKLKIGYAYKGTRKHKKLQALKSPDVVPIDYSLNEITPNIESITLNSNEEILAYSITDLIAEKYRSLLQQVERKRNRRQDVFDLNYLIGNPSDINSINKKEIMDCLIRKSKSRGITPDNNSFENPEVKSRAKKDYLTLQDEMAEKMPDFEEIFAEVLKFYRSLPWSAE